MCLICLQKPVLPDTCDATMPGLPEGRKTPAQIAFTSALDDHDEGIGTASVIFPDSSLTGQIEVGLDQDWFAISLEAGVTYGFGASGGGALDTVMALFDSNEVTLVFNDDVDFSTLDAGFSYTPSQTGTYYLAVAAFGEAETGSYGLAVTTGSGGGGVDPDDFPASTATSGRVTVGGTASGTLEQAGDQDWFALSLEAGQDVLITQTGSTLTDPYLRLVDAQGTVLAENDDYQGLDSALRFTSDRAQTVYVAAGSFNGAELGSYTVAANPYVSQPYDPVATIATGLNVPDPANIRVYLAPNGYSYSDSSGTYGSEGFTAYEQSRFQAAFDGIEAVANVGFTLVGSATEADFVILLDISGDIDAGLLGFFEIPGSPGPQRGVFNGLNWDRGANGDLGDGGYGFVTLNHELLHGMGLAHPHDSGGGSQIMGGVFAEDGDYGDDLLNQGIFTTMSYNTGYFTGSPGSQGDLADQGNVGGQWGYEIGPMALDIAALVAQYGPNTQTGLGNQTYVLPDANTNGTGWQAIWDNGGTDTLAYDGTRDAVLDLRAATLQDDIGGGGFVSAAFGIAGGFTIAHGVVIENARSGAGHDLLIGNGADNRLEGGAGDDTLIGGAGNDIAVIDADFASAVVTEITGGYRIETPDGSDEIMGIERVAFRDQTVLAASLLGGGVPEDDHGADLASMGTLLGSPFFAAIETPGDVDWLATGRLEQGGDYLISLRGFGLNDPFLRLLDRSGAAFISDDDSGLGRNAEIRFSPLDTDSYILEASATGNGTGDYLLEITDLLIGQGGGSGGPGQTLSGNGRADTLIGGAGDDILHARGGSDFVEGQGGNDLIQGGIGFDTLMGGDGDDTLVGSDGYDDLRGGIGFDTLAGGNGFDTLYGDAGRDTLSGGLGTDSLSGGSEGDLISGNAGADTANGGFGNDTLEGNAGADLLRGDEDHDLLNGGISNDTLLGGFGVDTLNGGNGFDSLSGGEGRDSLEGNAGGDTLEGGAGDDLLRGGIGADVFRFVPGSDHDVIVDFQNNIDRLELDSALMAQASPVAEDLRAHVSFNAAGHLVLSFENGDDVDSLTLRGMTRLAPLLDDVVFV